MATLAAEGLTNQLIADRLFISLNTVKGHLAQVVAKLGVTGRSDLVREVPRLAQPPPSSSRSDSARRRGVAA